MLTNFKRVLHHAVLDFFRNKGLSLAAIFVLIITTMLVTGLFFMQGVSGFLVDSIQRQIDITAFFKEDVSEEEVYMVREKLLQDAPEIKSIEYTSKEDALAAFTEKYKDSDAFSQALLEVGGNPFLPSLNITTNGEPADYKKISTILEGDEFRDKIEKVDFNLKKGIIERVFSITSKITTFGLVLGILLIVIAMMVVFNTMKLVIEASKEEISTMRIVGASKWFVRSPFILEGVMFGVASFIFCIIITAILVWFLDYGTAFITGGFSLITFFLANLWLVVVIQLGFGILVGIISSVVAMRKYLRV